MAGIVLAYLAARESVSHFIVDRDPVAAGSIWPASAEAKTRIAEELVANAVTLPEVARANGAAKEALKAAPLSIGALRSVALARALERNQAEAAPLMRLAGERNLRDPQVQLWLFQDAMDARRYAEAFNRANVLLRRRPEAEALVFPRMGAALGDPTAGPILIRALSTAPSWREDFVRDLAASAGPLGNPAQLLQALAHSPKPPTDREVLFVTSAMVGERRYKEARRLWSELVAARTGDGALVYNGDFERPPGAPPFDWQLAQDGGVLGQILDRPGDGKALYMEFPAGRSAEPAKQLLVLPRSGMLRLSARAMVEQLPGDSGINLMVRCVEDGKVLSEVKLRSVTAWRAISTDFPAPAEGCEAQWLSVRSELGASLNSVRAWFDKIEISPVD